MTPILTRFATAAIAALAAFACMSPDMAKAADLTGIWLTEDGRARVRTEHCGGDGQHLCGYVVWLQKPEGDDGRSRTDRYNPEARRQARPILGHQMLLGLKPNAEGRFEGKIYNGDNGKAYDVTVWSESPTELSVKGCMLAVFCGSQVWTRESDVAPGQLQAATDAPGGPRADPEWAAKSAPGTGSKGRQPDGPKAPTR